MAGMNAEQTRIAIKWHLNRARQQRRLANDCQRSGCTYHAGILRMDAHRALDTAKFHRSWLRAPTEEN